MWKRVSGIRRRSTTKVHIFNFFGGISMHTSTGRVVAPVRRMIVIMAALFVMMACTMPAAFAQAQGQNTQPPPTQQQPGSITNPQPGAITQEHVANPPGNVPPHEAGGEANLKLPDMSSVSFLDGKIDGYKLLSIGLIFCALGGLFGLMIYMQLKNLPVHRAMREISELLYETCKTYLITQGKFILILEAFIAVVIILYFGLLLHFDAVKVIIILLFSLVGIGGSYGVAWFWVRGENFPKFCTPFCRVGGQAFSVFSTSPEGRLRICLMVIR